MALKGDLIFTPITDIELSEKMGIDDLETEISGKSTVTYTPTVTSGTELGKIKIDGTTKKIYAPTIPAEKHIEWVTVAEAEANKTYGEQLTLLNTALATLTEEEQLNTRIIRGGTNIFDHSHQYSYNQVVRLGSSLVINYLRLDTPLYKYMGFAESDGAITSGDSTDTIDNYILKLQVLRLVDNE